MLTVTIARDDSDHEEVFQCERISYESGQIRLHTDESTIVLGNSESNGEGKWDRTAFVMNDLGKTIAKYRLFALTVTEPVKI